MLQQQERQIAAPACQPKLPFEQNLRLRRKIAIGLCCAALPVMLLFGYAAAKNTEMLKHLQTQAWEQVFLDTQAMPWVQKSVPEKQYAEALRLAHAGKTQEALVQAEQLTNLAEAKELAWMLRRYHAAEQATDLQQRHDQFGALGEFLDSAERKKETETALLQAAWTALNTKDYRKAEEMFASIDIEEAEVGLTLAGAGRTLADAAAGGTQSQKALKRRWRCCAKQNSKGTKWVRFACKILPRNHFYTEAGLLPPVKHYGWIVLRTLFCLSQPRKEMNFSSAGRGWKMRSERSSPLGITVVSTK